MTAPSPTPTPDASRTSITAPFDARVQLRISVALFLAWGVTWASGIVGLPLLFARGFPPWLLFSQETDAALLGAPPDAIRAAQPAAAEVQWFLSHLIAIGVAPAGIAISAITWFGLRRGLPWAFWTLVVASLPVAILYPRALSRYLRPDVPLGLADLQPFVTLPALVVPPAIVLAWLALRTTARPYAMLRCAARRNSPGGIPNHRRNALLKDTSDS